MAVVLLCSLLGLTRDRVISPYPLAGLECPRPGWGSHEQTERTEDRVLSYLQRRPLDHPLSVQGHPGPHAEGAGGTARAFHCRQGEARWLWYRQHTIHVIRFRFVLSWPLRHVGRLFLKWMMWLVFLLSLSLLFHQRSPSLHSLRRARLGSMCPRAWGMEGRGEGSPCSPTAEVGVSCDPFFYLLHSNSQFISHYSSKSVATYKRSVSAPYSRRQRHYSRDQSVWGHPWDGLAGALQTFWLHLEDLSGQGQEHWTVEGQRSS